MNARKRCLWHGIAGKGNRDDALVHSLPQSRPLADPAPSEREPWVRAFIFSTILSLQAYAKSLPLSGEVPRRGGGGTEAAFSTMLPGKAHGIPPTPHPARGAFCCDECMKLSPCKGFTAPLPGRPLGVYHVLTQYVNCVPSRGPPYGARLVI